MTKTMKAPKRLPKAQRREQLIDTALDIVRAHGTDALTLSYLAERASVSKPVVYDHFDSRSHLLIALYKRIDDAKVATLKLALESVPERLEDVARVIGESYMSCVSSNGPEWHAISAALKGDEEMEAVQRQLIDSYVDIYCRALAPYAALPAPQLRLRCVAIIGAAEVVSQDLIRERVKKASASAVLSSLITSWLAGAAPGPSKRSRRPSAGARQERADR